MSTASIRVDHNRDAQSASRQAWSAGDYSVLAHGTVLAGELLCDAADLRAGDRVLDVATGSGNTALAAARRCCHVTGIDFVRPLLERGRERAAAEHLEVKFTYGELEDIPFAASSFDVVLSTFGAMYAPHPDIAVREMLRVLRPGGRLGLTAWRPGGPSAAIFALEARYAPSASGADPMRWGVETEAAARIGPYVSSLILQRRSITVRSPSIADWMDIRLRNLGPLKIAYDALSVPERELMIQELRTRLETLNRSGDRTFLAENGYLEIIAIKR